MLDLQNIHTIAYAEELITDVAVDDTFRINKRYNSL
jgi:hypothetical protein